MFVNCKERVKEGKMQESTEMHGKNAGPYLVKEEKCRDVRRKEGIVQTYGARGK